MTAGSRKPSARTIGVVYLFFFVTSFIGLLLAKDVVVPGEPATTANNLLTHESLFNQWLSAFTIDQQQAAALLALKLYAQSFHISFVLFAGYDFLLGYLIFNSTFLPRFIGAWMMVAGIGWFTYIWPPLAAKLSVVAMPFGGLAEVVLMIWLLVKGFSKSQNQ